MNFFAKLPSLTEFAHFTVSGGYLISLSLVCLLQYVVYVYRMSCGRRELRRVKGVLRGLEDQFAESQRDWSVATVENDLLRNFLASPPPEKLVQNLLQRLVPDTSRGWAAYITLQPEPHVFQHRGLQECPPDVMDLEDENLLPVWTGYPVIFRDARVAKSRFLLNFGSADRNRSGKQLYVFGVRQGERCFGLIVTSTLFPEGVPVEQQTELIRRLCSGLARHLESLETNAVQEQELRLSADRLALRTLFDQHFDSPLQMTQQFVKTLQTRLNADRAVMFYSRSEDGIEGPAVASGAIPSFGSPEVWASNEEQLVRRTTVGSDCTLYDEYTLLGMGLNESIRSAILTPITMPLRQVGTLCLTRGTRVPFTVMQQHLVQWATDLYVDKLSFLIQHTEVTRLAKLDTITQIANRRVFDSELARELQIAYATSSELSLILLDIDRFKAVNDNLGHQAGDEVLRVFGGILRDCLAQLRAGDRALCARYGGDEFAVVLPGMGPLGAARIGELIRQHLIQSKIHWQERKLNITVSGGFATYPENGLTSEDLIRTADAALLNAKAGGRNTISWPESTPARSSIPKTEITPSMTTLLEEIGNPAPNTAGQ